MIEKSPFSPQEIRRQLARIEQSKEFQSSDTLRLFLDHVVEETLAGRADELKAYTIAVRALGRDPSFDPQADTIVRVQAGRLRRALRYYYLAEGATDPVHIEIPIGAYVPVFQPNMQVISPVASNGPQAVAPVEQLQQAAVLVLPPTVLRPNDESRQIAEELTGLLVVRLTEFRDIQVIASAPRTGSAEEVQDVRSLGRCYGASFVIYWQLSRRGRWLRIAVQLVQSTNGQVLWAKSFEASVTPATLGEFEEKVATQVAATIADSRGVIARSLTDNLCNHAHTGIPSGNMALFYQHYLSNLSEENWEVIHTAIEDAVRWDPDQEANNTLLATLSMTRYGFFGGAEELLRRARSLIQRALILDPTSLPAHTAQAFYYLHNGRRDLFFRKAEEVIRRHPFRASMLGDLGLHYVFCGESERGLALLERSIELNPHYPGWYHYARCFEAYRCGRFEAALTEVVHFSLPGFYWDALWRAAVFGRLGRRSEAEMALADMTRLLPKVDLPLEELIRRLVVSTENVESVLEGLRAAGWTSRVRLSLPTQMPNGVSAQRMESGVLLPNLLGPSLHRCRGLNCEQCNEGDPVIIAS